MIIQKYSSELIYTLNVLTEYLKYQLRCFECPFTDTHQHPNSDHRLPQASIGCIIQPGMATYLM